jgi:hypothetical protein
MNPTVIETIRGFRGAIAAGSIWILAVWVAFHSHIDPQVSHSATATVLGRLVELLGQAGSLIALLILAAAAGSVSQQIFRAPSMWLGSISTWFVRIIEATVASVIGIIRRRRVLRRFESWTPFAVDLARRMVESQETHLRATGSHMSRQDKQETYRLYDRSIRQELLDPSKHATLIHVLDEQANLRFGLVIPILALTIALALDLSQWFWLLALVPFVISFQAGEYRELCNELLEKIARSHAVAPDENPYCH